MNTHTSQKNHLNTAADTLDTATLSRRELLATLGAAISATLVLPGCGDSNTISIGSLRGAHDLSQIYSLKELVQFKRSLPKGMLVKLDQEGATAELVDPVATVNSSGTFFKFKFTISEKQKPILLVADTKDFTVTPDTVVVIQGKGTLAPFLDARKATLDERMKEVGLQDSGKEDKK